MLRWLKGLIGKGPRGGGDALSAPTLHTIAPASSLDDVYGGVNADLFDGVEFSATLQVRTPLAVLVHHGEVFNGPPSAAPRYGTEADGIWLPRMAGELGALLSAGRTHASDAGPVEPERYLVFLRQFREVVESDLTLDRKLQALERFPRRSKAFAEFWAQLGRNYDDWPNSFFYTPLTQLPGVGRTTARRLWEAGYRTLADLGAATDAQLLEVKGVGSATVAAIRKGLES